MSQTIAAQSWKLPQSSTVRSGQLYARNLGQVDAGSDALVLDRGTPFGYDRDDVVFAKPSNGGVHGADVAAASREIKSVLQEKGSISGQELSARGITVLRLNQSNELVAGNQIGGKPAWAEHQRDTYAVKSLTQQGTGVIAVLDHAYEWKFDNDCRVTDTLS